MNRLRDEQYVKSLQLNGRQTPSDCGDLGGSMSQVAGSNTSYKPITNTAWVHDRLCKLQKGCTRLAAASDKVYQLLAHGRWFSPDTPASSTTKTGRHDIAEILLKVALKHQKSKINQHRVVKMTPSRENHQSTVTGAPANHRLRRTLFYMQRTFTSLKLSEIFFQQLFNPQLSSQPPEKRVLPPFSECEVFIVQIANQIAELVHCNI